MMKHRFHMYALLCLIVVNLAIRFYWITYHSVPQQSDFLYYYQHAVQISHGQGYTEQGHYTDYFPMGYMFFLAFLFKLFGASVYVGLTANVLLSTGIVVLLYVLATRVTRNQYAALIAAVGYTLLPSQIFWDGVTGTEELFTFGLLLASTVYFFALNKKWYFMIVPGIFFGLASIVRPILLFYPVFLFLYEWIFVRKSFKKSFLSILVLTIAMFVAMSPATIRNYVSKKEFVLVSTNGGVNLWQGLHTNSGYYWSSDPKVNPLMAAGSDEHKRDQIGKHVFEQFVIHHPVTAVKNGVKKIYYLYNEDKSFATWYSWNRHTSQTIQHVSTIYYRLLFGIAVLGLIYTLLRRKFMYPLVYIIYNSALFFFFPAWDRFRYPLMPFWTVFFGIAVYAAYARVIRKRTWTP